MLRSSRGVRLHRAAHVDSPYMQWRKNASMVFGAEGDPFAPEVLHADPEPNADFVLAVPIAGARQ